MNLDIDSLREQLLVHRRNLADLQIKKAKYGLDVSPSILRQIEDEESEIGQIEKTIKRLSSHKKTLPERNSTGKKSPLTEPKRKRLVNTVGAANLEFDKKGISRRKYLTKLRQRLGTCFSEGELKTLCFDLGIDYDSLPDTGLENKARELVQHLERLGRVPELVVACQERRPQVPWTSV